MSHCHHLYDDDLWIIEYEYIFINLCSFATK